MVDLEALAQIEKLGKVLGAKRDSRTMIAIAHGLAYDPHVEGRLKLTPVGRERLAGAAEPAQGSLL